MENLYIKLKNLYKNVYNINIYLYDNINIIKYYKYLNNDFSISNECLTITINKNYEIILEDSIGIINNKYKLNNIEEIYKKIQILL
tara:strand:+ start:180 stop:437 length:258 start_codon:yes stop_codon:yes gene_type:complete